MTRPRRLHPAWVVLGALALCMMAASGLRAVFGVYIKPIEAEFGWSRSVLSGVAALSLLLLGAVGPLMGRLADRWGPRRVLLLSLLLLAAGTIGAGYVRNVWDLYATVGLSMAVGAGGLGLATGASVVARWFDTRRGLVMGVVGGGMSAGQMIVIPLATALTLTIGWRASYVWLGVGLLLVVLPLGFLLVRDDPRDRGLRPYGAEHASAAPAPRDTTRVSVFAAARTSQFWLLVSTFFVCGYTSNGLVLTHFMPHAIEHNFTQVEASAALGVMGAMNVLGTIGSGWFCDRFGRRVPLAVYYFVRGLSLLFLLWVWNVPSLHVWAAVFGLNYISTVPPTTTLTATIFGRYSVGELSGWIFFAHQVGAALAAALAGWIFEWTGSYSSAFVSAAVLAFLASGLALAIRDEPYRRPLAPAPATS